MSTFNILYLGGVICAFVILAAILSWDDYRTVEEYWPLNGVSLNHLTQRRKNGSMIPLDLSQ